MKCQSLPEILTRMPLQRNSWVYIFPSHLSTSWRKIYVYPSLSLFLDKMDTPKMVFIHDRYTKNGRYSPRCNVKEPMRGFNHENMPINEWRQIDESGITFGGPQGQGWATRGSGYSIISQQKLREILGASLLLCMVFWSDIVSFWIYVYLSINWTMAPHVCNAFQFMVSKMKNSYKGIIKNSFPFYVMDDSSFTCS